MSIFAKLWHEIEARLPFLVHRYKVALVDELPEKLQRDKLYAIQPGPWAAALLCPCGCGDTIHLSLLEEERPSWGLVIDKKGQPSLHPSVWRTQACRSHFFLTSGEIRWAEERSYTSTKTKQKKKKRRESKN